MPNTNYVKQLRPNPTHPQVGMLLLIKYFVTISWISHCHYYVK